VKLQLSPWKLQGQLQLVAGILSQQCHWHLLLLFLQEFGLSCCCAPLEEPSCRFAQLQHRQQQQGRPFLLLLVVLLLLLAALLCAAADQAATGVAAGAVALCLVLSR
jgi:hypothetical protein